MIPKIKLLVSALLTAALLAGCVSGADVPAETENQAELSVEDVYISKVPLDSQKNTKPQDQVEETTEATTEEEVEEPTEETIRATTEETTDATTETTEAVTEEPPGETTPEPAPETTPQNVPEPVPETTAEPVEETSVSADEALENEAVVLPSGGAAVSNVSTAVASGVNVKSNEEAAIDYSNIGDGYVMAQYTASTSQKLKVQVKGPVTTYTYNLMPQQWSAFPLSDENGEYQITIYKNVVDTKYAAVLSLTVSVSMEDEFAPFIHSNQYVNFDAAPNTVATAAAIAGGIADPLQKVAAIYHYVVYGMTYDTELAATVTSGYLPDLDSVLAKMSGICFDYAALMTGMLRSQGVPTKLVVGYVGDVYHAWINVWSDSEGWVEGVVYFDGTSWQRMDPTFASSGGAGIMEYIGDGANYAAKYFY